jgi:hypothetical protein
MRKEKGKQEMNVHTPSLKRSAEKKKKKSVVDERVPKKEISLHYVHPWQPERLFFRIHLYLVIITQLNEFHITRNGLEGGQKVLATAAAVAAVTASEAQECIPEHVPDYTPVSVGHQTGLYSPISSNPQLSSRN